MTPMIGSRRPPERPSFFIVGAPKCGTTSMAEYLDRHPALSVLRGEPHRFGSDIRYNPTRIDERAYRALCHGTGPGVRVGDRSTWYLYSHRAADEIHAACPDAKIIAMVRDPAEMIHSLHAHHVLRGGRDDCPSLAEALEREAERRRGLGIPAAARFPESLFYREIPRYAEQLQRYFRRFGRDRVHVVVFDDLRDDPAAAHRAVLAFLGVEPVEQATYRRHNPAGPAPDDWLHRAWKRSPLRYRLRSAVPASLYRWLRRHRPLQRWRAAPTPAPPPLDDALRARLDARFLPEVERLEAVLGRSLPGWASSARGSDRGRIAPARRPRSASPETGPGVGAGTASRAASGGR